MSANTSIEWTHRPGTVARTWNPTTGCDKISPGCGLPRPGSDDTETSLTGGCYALTMARRLKAMGSAKYQTDGDPRTSGPGFGVAVHPDALGDPLKWRKPSTVFVNSMSDLFHARVPRAFVAQAFAVMAATPEHVYQVLTKRPERMARIVGSDGFHDAVEEAMAEYTHAGIDTWPLPNVWLGTSIESAEHVGRTDRLRETPAALRFISAEPLIGPHDGLDLTGIDWLIAGGESGPNARPMHPKWLRDLRDRCDGAGVAFFLKQWGRWAPVCDQPAYGDRWIHLDGRSHEWDHGDGRMKAGLGPWTYGDAVLMRRARSKHDTGRELDGRTHDAFPELVPA